MSQPKYLPSPQEIEAELVKLRVKKDIEEVRLNLKRQKEPAIREYDVKTDENGVVQCVLPVR